MYVNEALPSKATRARKLFTAYTLKLIVPHLLALRMIKLLVAYIQLHPLFLELTSTGVMKIQSWQRNKWKYMSAYRANLCVEGPGKIFTKTGCNICYQLLDILQAVNTLVHAALWFLMQICALTFDVEWSGIKVPDISNPELLFLLNYFHRVYMHITTWCCVVDLVGVWACFVMNEKRFWNTAYTVFIC